MRGLMAGLVLISLVGCASSTKTLQRLTAPFCGAHVDPEQIVIVDPRQGVLNQEWQALCLGQRLACQSDDMARQGYCFAPAR